MPNKSKEMLTLQVPGGELCFGCMFLKVNWMDNFAKCNLFGEILHGDRKWGDLDQETIKKCDGCPKSEAGQ